MRNRIPTHPGVILNEEFLEPLSISQAEIARQVNISTQHINELVNGRRGITPETAWLLSGALNTTPEFWMNLQTAYDLALNCPSKKVESITVTRNGYDAFVVMRSDEYEAIQEELAKARLLAKVAQAEHEYATGQHSDGKEFTEKVRAKHGL